MIMFSRSLKKFVLLIFLICSGVLYGQEQIMYKGVRYYPIPNDYIHSEYEKSKYTKEISNYLGKAIYVDNVVKPKIKGSDSTDEIQTVLNENDVVVLPNRTIKINEKGLRLKSHQILIFQENTKLELLPNDKTHFAVLIIDEIENVKVFNANIVGERFEHLGTSGQWGMGIRVIAAKNVKIYNPRVKEMWGDGIYIGGRRGIPSQNIEVYNAHLDNNRRNALSITSADGVKLIKPLVANANGQSPKAGIDIEPNNNDDIINNIFIDQPTSFYNPIYGIVVSLTKLPGAKPKEVNVTVNNPLIIGGKYGIAVLGIYKNPNKHKLEGKIEVNNLTTYYNALTIKEFSKPKFNIRVAISNMKIYHKSKRGSIYSNEKQLDKFLKNIEVLNEK